MFKDEFMNFLKVKVLEVSKDTVKVEGEVKREYVNVHGTAHGSYIFSLMDFAFSILSNLDKRRVAVSISVDYLKPAYEGDKLIGEASVVERTRRFLFCEIKVKKHDKTIAYGKAISYSPDLK